MGRPGLRNGPGPGRVVLARHGHLGGPNLVPGDIFLCLESLVVSGVIDAARVGLWQFKSVGTNFRNRQGQRQFPFET